MPIQTILSSAELSRMKQLVSHKESLLTIYSKGDHYPLPKSVKLLRTLISTPDITPVLKVGKNKTEIDAENAVKLYEYLGPLSRTQAADTRLWATLTHTTFWTYCQKRWPSIDRDSNYIHEHWFEKRGGGLGALRRNAISRLWWAAHLTVAPWDRDNDLMHLKSSDRYKFTKILLSQAQIFQDVLEREYGSNTRLRILLLSALDKHLGSVSNKDTLSKTATKNLLLKLKYQHVDALPVPDAERVINELVATAANQQLVA